jgi:hypothetical protein
MLIPLFWRNYSIKEQNIENEEPRGTGIQDGGAIGEELEGQRVWSDV